MHADGSNCKALFWLLIAQQLVVVVGQEPGCSIVIFGWQHEAYGNNQGPIGLQAAVLRVAEHDYCANNVDFGSCCQALIKWQQPTAMAAMVY